MADIAPPTLQEVREELDRLLEDAAFRRAPSHSRLLRYLVERKAAGDNGALCEAGIAMAVFQRDPASYDAEIDPIVRVSIGRLRERLEKHYQHFDRVPETIIMLPKGRYAPEFRRRPARVAARVGRGLAVMQTVNLTGEPGLDALARGLSDRLGEALVLMGWPRVIAPGSVHEAQRDGESAAAIGRQLGVAEVIETSLAPEAGGRLRVSARLIRVAEAELAWAEARTLGRDQPYPGIDALFDAVLARFAAAPGGVPGGAPGSAPGVAAAGRPLLPAAARGMIESAKILITHLDLPSIERAQALLAEVTRDFPDAADAWALRGRTCVRRLNFGDQSPQPLVAELELCARTAIAISPDHIEARALHALVLHWRGALPDAEAQFRDVLRSAPNHTSARLGYAWLLLAQGRIDEALTEFDVAASFDPMSLNVLFNRAFTLVIARRHDEARAAFETGLRTGESLFGVMACASNEIWSGDLDRAEALYRRVAELAPGAGVAEYGQAWIAALRGDREQANALRATAHARSPGGTFHYSDAVLHAILGEPAAALAALRRSIAAMENMRLLAGIDPAFERFADDPDFRSLLATLGLSGWCGVPDPRAGS